MKLTYDEAEALRGDPEFQAFCEAIRDAGEPCTLQDCADVFASLKAARLLRAPLSVAKGCGADDCPANLLEEAERDYAALESRLVNITGLLESIAAQESRYARLIRDTLSSAPAPSAEPVEYDVNGWKVDPTDKCCPECDPETSAEPDHEPNQDCVMLGCPGVIPEPTLLERIEEEVADHFSYAKRVRTRSAHAVLECIRDLLRSARGAR